MEFGQLPQAAIGGIILLITLILYIGLTIALNHHWDRYEVEASRRQRVKAIYFTGSAILGVFLVIAFLFLI